MKLEKLNNEYRSGDGEVKNIIPLGYVGSKELMRSAINRPVSYTHLTLPTNREV